MPSSCALYSCSMKSKPRAALLESWASNKYWVRRRRKKEEEGKVGRKEGRHRGGRRN